MGIMGLFLYYGANYGNYGILLLMGNASLRTLSYGNYGYIPYYG